MAIPSSIFLWRIPWTEQPGYSLWGHKEMDTTMWLTLHFASSSSTWSENPSFPVLLKRTALYAWQFLLILFFSIATITSLHIILLLFSCSVMSNSLQPHGTQSTRLLCPWNSPGRSTEVGCHALLQGIFLIQGSNPGLLHWRWILYYVSHQGSQEGTKRC